ncbi:hypothetical protein D0Z07_2499 [Hyphodiscus hymeniophilus]|uniref:Rhodopsin domain-containing protein n=1 Tax=Hyphodiscus hymeniophilus TaxID=353542 RepID=A0A9P6VP25_9HELO|nr:hypothetical protein D0Z07_2499 [Hyphodiscus hymeniophilus]
MAEDRGPQLGLSWLFVFLRCYVKAFISKSWAADDFLLIVSLIFFSTYAACSLSGIKYGTGRHVDDIPIADMPKALYFWWLCELFYTITTVFIRLSIAVFLLRIAIKPLHRGIIFGTLGTVIAFSLFYFFLIIFQCHPVSFFWQQYAGQKGSCINPAAVPDASIAHSAVSFTADWVLGLLPIFLVYHLQMNLRTKVSVACILSLGLLAGVATMIRIPYIKVLALTDDFLFATTDVAIWSTVEPGLGIVAAGAVTLRPLFRTFYALSTRNRSAHLASHKRNSCLPPQLQNSKLGQMEMDSRQHTYKSSVVSRGGSEEIQPGHEAGDFGEGSKKGALVTSSNPFVDESEAEYQSKESLGGIQVQRTVEVRRGEYSSKNSLSSDGSETQNQSWLRSDTD